MSAQVRYKLKDEVKSNIVENYDEKCKNQFFIETSNIENYQKHLEGENVICKMGEGTSTSYI